MKRKVKLKKLIFSILIAILLLQICVPVFVQADYTSGDWWSGLTKPETNTNPEQDQQMQEAMGETVDWAAGILLYPFKFFIFIIGKVVQLATSMVVGDDTQLSVETILFNKLELTDINFFSSNTQSDFVRTLRENVAIWYYAIRNIAIIASLAVLVYVGIRMAISTVAAEEAKYKQMLSDWLVSFALIFVLHYIIMLTINVNNALVDILAKTSPVTTGNVMSTYIDQVAKSAYGITQFTEGFGSAIVYVIMVIVLLGFLIMYIKRLIVTAFLIVIAPLVTITYSIDKVKDQKAQALNSWLKEFMWNILIQPFHCIIYIVFASIAISALANATWAGSILAVMSILFIMSAEDIVKNIFSIKSDQTGKLGGAAALVAASMFSTSKATAKYASDKIKQSKGSAPPPPPPANNTPPDSNNPQPPSSSPSPSGGGTTPSNPEQSDAPAKSSMSPAIVAGMKKLGGTVLKYGVEKQWKAAAMVAGGAIGAVEGNAAKIGAGVILGKTIGGHVSDFTAGAGTKLMNAISQPSRYVAPNPDNPINRRRNDIHFAEDRMKAANDILQKQGNYSPDDMVKRANEAMKNNSGDYMNEAEKKFAEAVNKAKDSHMNSGAAQEAAEKAVLDAIKKASEGTNK